MMETTNSGAIFWIHILHLALKIYLQSCNFFYRDKYGFVTFEDKPGAYAAFDRGPEDPLLQSYDISFGGRRIFCKTEYADLGNNTYISFVILSILLSTLRSWFLVYMCYRQCLWRVLNIAFFI